MDTTAAAARPASARRACKAAALTRAPGACFRTAAAGLLALLLLAAGCSSESATDPAPVVAEPGPEPASTSRERPAPAARPAPDSQSYAALWRAASAASAGGGSGQATSRRASAGLPAPEPSGAAVQRLQEPGAASEWPEADSAAAEAPAPGTDPSAAGNAPEYPAAPDGSSDDATSNSPALGGHLRMEDYAQLSPYLEGIASWYGPNFHGKATANGETYNQYGLTAAHPVLPIGTRVLVENLSNGRRVWLRINDRGPYVKGRVLDLSRIAAERLGIIAQGTAPVRITVLKWPESVEPVHGLKAFQQYAVQAAAYPELASAEGLRERLQARHPWLPFFVDRASNGFYAVAAGPFDDEREARQAARSLRLGGLTPLVKRYRN